MAQTLVEEKTATRRKRKNPITSLTHDNRLALDLREGKLEAIEAFSSQFLQPIYGYFFRQVEDEVMAESLTTETFRLAMLSLQKGITFAIGAGPWLFGIAHHVVQAYDARTFPLPSLSFPTDQLEKLGQHVYTEHQKRAGTSHLWNLVNRLSPEQQQVLQLRYKDGLSYIEIALQMKCTVYFCQKLHSSALKKLDKLVHQQQEGA